MSIVNGYSEKPEFNWEEQFIGVLVDESLVNYMQSTKLTISIIGTDMLVKEKPSRPKRLERPKDCLVKEKQSRPKISEEFQDCLVF